MIHKLLIAYDGSDSAKAAFDFALDLAEKYGAELHVLAVARPPEFGAEVETEVVVGHPAESIVLYAEDHDIDHIVLGHRGHSLFERWLLGSVARQVIAYAHCTVTVVR